MPRAIAALCLLLAAASPVEAQIDYYARVGLTGSTRLVRDVLFEPIATEAGLAPSLFAGASYALSPQIRVGFEGTLARASLSGSGASGDGEDADLGHVTTLTGMVNLDGPLAIPPLRWRVGGGLIRYSGSEEQGAFAQGGITRYIVGAGVDYRRRSFGSWDLMLSARYDLHRFTTEELRDRGFTQSQSVQRGSVSIGLARSST